MLFRSEFKSWESGVTQIEMAVEDLYHPLLQEAVANSFQVAGGTLVTGSNASGKSTFLKNVAMNSILAQTLVTCTCSSYQAPFLKVMTSMALRDDIESGESYFIVEIKSLKRILEESKKREEGIRTLETRRHAYTVSNRAPSARLGHLSVSSYCSRSSYVRHRIVLSSQEAILQLLSAL